MIRNKLKRRIREAYRIISPNYSLQGFDIAIIYNNAIVHSYGNIKHAIEQFIVSLTHENAQ